MLLLHLVVAAQVRGSFILELEDFSSRRLKSADVQLTPNRVFEPLICEASGPEQALGCKGREGLGAGMRCEERGRDRTAPSSTAGQRAALSTLLCSCHVQLLGECTPELRLKPRLKPRLKSKPYPDAPVQAGVRISRVFHTKPPPKILPTLPLQKQ